MFAALSAVSSQFLVWTSRFVLKGESWRFLTTKCQIFAKINSPVVKPLPPRPGFVAVGAVNVAGVVVLVDVAPNSPPEEVVAAGVLPKSPPDDAVVVVVAAGVAPKRPVEAVVVAAVVVACVDPKEKPVEAVVVVVEAAGVAVFPNENVEGVVLEEVVVAVAVFPNVKPVVPVTVAGLAAVLFVPKLNILKKKKND